MTNELTRIQRTKTDIMRGLHIIYGFNFEQPYRAVKVCGSTTVKALEKAVCADKDDVVVALVSDGSMHPSYKAVSLSPYHSQGFEIETAKRIFRIPSVSFWKAFSDFNSKKEFSEARSWHDSEIIVVAQSSSFFFNRINEDKYRARIANVTDLKSTEMRYKVVETTKRSYGTEISLRERTDKCRTCNMTAYERNSESVSDCIDKSGFLVKLYRDELKKRSEERKAELKKAEFMKEDFSARVTTLREVINMKKAMLADTLRNASTAKELEYVRDNISYWHGLLDLFRDFEEFESNIKNKSFASIKDCDAHYNRILKYAMSEI